MDCCNIQDLTKEDNQMAKGLAIMGMVALHLFCRLGELSYTPLIYVGQVPLVYYLGLFGDLCVPVYCFCSGYAHYLLKEKHIDKYPRVMLRKLMSFIKNYWIVLIVFSILGMIFDKTNAIPGDIGAFLGNFFLVKLSYNGAWWFVLTYIILSVLSPLIFKIVNKIPIVPLILLSGCIYFVCYIFRFDYILPISIPIVSWVCNQAILLGTSQFTYVVGMIFRKEKIVAKLKKKLNCSDVVRRACIVICPILLLIFHGVVQSAIIAPITGIGTLVCFYLWKKSDCIEKFFMFLGKHSTNIWLVHMFFYARLFKDFVFIFKYPIFIFIFMLGVCIGVSKIIQKVMSFNVKGIV